MPAADDSADSGARTVAHESPAPARILKATAERAAEMLSCGAGAVEEIGRRAGADAADALKLLEAVSGSASQLLKVNLQLVPLMTSLQRHRSKYKWWRWFTGEQLEQEVFFTDVCKQIEILAEQGQGGHAGMATQIALLTAQHQLMGTEIELLEADIEAARLLASPAYAGHCRRAGLDRDDLARLVRRTSNLESMVTATRLTRVQYQVAIQHAKSVSDRYGEIRSLLLPIWKQSVGFDLFSHRVSDQLG
ncbi:MAG: hypothetical protein V4632_10770 [Pseudomonadota bacterium]